MENDAFLCSGNESSTSIVIRLHFQRGWWDSYFTITVILKHKSQTRSVDSHCCSSSSSPLCWFWWRAAQDSSYVGVQTHWGMKGSREWVMYDDTAKCGSVGAKGGLKPGKRIWTLKIPVNKHRFRNRNIVNYCYLRIMMPYSCLSEDQMMSSFCLILKTDSQLYNYV